MRTEAEGHGRAAEHTGCLLMRLAVSDAGGTDWEE